MWWVVVLGVICLLLYQTREGFKLHVEADVGSIAIPKRFKKWTETFAKDGRAFVWNLIPFKHVYRRWRRKI